MRWIVLGVLALSTSADAGDAASVTAASVAAAPLPGHESGRIDEGDGGDGAARIAIRGLLFVPKLAVEAVEAPIRGAVWLNARYDVTGAYERVFFNDAHTVGVLPTGSFDTHFGWSAGARFIARDLFDEHESFDLGAAAGETWRVNASSSLRSGKRFGDHVEVALAGSFERHPNDIFYGIGNGDLRPGPPAAPIDPRVDDTAILARYRYEMERVALVGDYRQGKQLHVRATGSMEDLDLGPSMNSRSWAARSSCAATTPIGFATWSRRSPRRSTAGISHTSSTPRCSSTSAAFIRGSISCRSIICAAASAPRSTFTATRTS